MFKPSELSPRTRRVAAGVIHRAWRWAVAVGTIAPGDTAAGRFAHMGPGSCIAFPPGDVFGEARISIGADTLVAALVSLAVGMPGEAIDPTAEPVIVIGERCMVGRGSSIVARSRIEIGDDVTIAPTVYITDHNHTYGNVDEPIKQQWPASAPVTIGSGSWLGCGVVVLPGASIGRHVAVAAGSVVRGDVPDFSVVAGVPAKVVRRYTVADGWVPPLPEVEGDGDAPAGWPFPDGLPDAVAGTVASRRSTWTSSFGRRSSTSA